MINDFAKFLLQPDVLFGILSAVAVFATIITIAAPFLFLDRDFKARMKSIVSERDSIKLRERNRLVNQNKKPKALLKQNTGGVIRELVEKLNLRRALADENTFINLKMAGYRKQSHVYIFLFFRLILPIIMFLITLIYVFVISGMQHPPAVKFIIALVVAYIGFYVPILYIRNKISKRQSSIRNSWPDALDLLLICIEAGMSIEVALNKVSHEIGIQSMELAEELVLTNAELSYIQNRRKAYENLALRTGLDSVKSMSLALIQSERYGTSLGVAIRVLAEESREMRMLVAEKKAASLPPKLTVPMMLFFLPVLFFVILGPAMIKIFAS